MPCNAIVVDVINEKPQTVSFYLGIRLLRVNIPFFLRSNVIWLYSLNLLTDKVTLFLELQFTSCQSYKKVRRENVGGNFRQTNLVSGDYFKIYFKSSAPMSGLEV